MAYLGTLANWLDKIKGSFKNATISGTTITLTKHDDTTVTLVTQDTVYTHPTTSGYKHIPSGGSSGKILRWSSDGTAVWDDEQGGVSNAFANIKVGATTIEADSAADTFEIVAGSNITITPDATDDKITIAAVDTTYSVATSSANGLMSSTDKAAWDALQTILSGGAEGQVLSKTSSGYAWADLANLDVNPTGV